MAKRRSEIGKIGKHGGEHIEIDRVRAARRQNALRQPQQLKMQ